MIGSGAATMRVDVVVDPAMENMPGYIETWVAPLQGYIVVRRTTSTGVYRLTVHYRRLSDYRLRVRPLLCKRYGSDNITETIADPARTKSGWRELRQQMQNMRERGRLEKRILIR